MLTSDEPRTLAPSADPELLIEEARQRQRRRQRERAAFLFAAVVLLGLTLAITQITQGGSGVKAAQSPPAVAAAGSDHYVIYEKFQLVWASPHQPTVRAVIRSWTDPVLRTWRETVLGRPALEYGGRYVQDQRTGPELADYLYDRHTGALYLTSTTSVPARQPWRQPTAQMLRRQLASTPFRPAGTRVYAGRTVLAFTAGRSSPRVPHSVLYVDPHTYVPVFYAVNIGAPKTWTRIVARAIVWRVLPANKANLKLANLTTAHPGTRIVPERGVVVGRSLGTSIYRTEPQHVSGLPATFESNPMIPLYWDMFFGPYSLGA